MADYVPKAALYEKEGQVDYIADVPTDTPVSDLSRVVHLHGRSVLSAAITGGWIFYANNDFNAGADAQVEYYYGTHGTGIPLRKFGGHIGSVRYVGSSQDCRVDTITLFSRRHFQGTEELVPDHYPNVNVEVSSFVITGTGPWTVYDEPNYGGKSITFVPKTSPNFHPGFVVDVAKYGINPDTIKSVRRAQDGEQVYEV